MHVDHSLQKIVWILVRARDYIHFTYKNKWTNKTENRELINKTQTEYKKKKKIHAKSIQSYSMIAVSRILTGCSNGIERKYVYPFGDRYGMGAYAAHACVSVSNSRLFNWERAIEKNERGKEHCTQQNQLNEEQNRSVSNGNERAHFLQHTHAYTGHTGTSRRNSSSSTVQDQITSSPNYS